MSDWLILRLPREADEPAEWMVADARGLLVQAPRTTSLTEAAAAAGPRRVCVLVPGADVLLTDAALPARAKAQRLAQVAPFALEEQVADDIESLHFALGKRTAGAERTPVAIVDRVLLRDWLGRLESAGLIPDLLCPDAALVPANPGQAVAWLERDELVVRAPDRLPQLIPLDTLRGALERAGLGAADSLMLAAPAPDWEPHAAELPWMQEHFETARVQLLPQGSLPWLAAQIDSAQPINLLQGAFAPKRSRGIDVRRWRVPAALAALVLLLYVGGTVLDIRRLGAAEAVLDAEIDQVFRSAMPGAGDSTDARRSMEQRLMAVQASGGAGAGFLPTLASLASASAGVPDTTVRSLSFRDGALDLRVTAPDASSLDRITQGLRANGLPADITSGNAAGEAYEGQIRIEARGAG